MSLEAKRRLTLVVPSALALAVAALIGCGGDAPPDRQEPDEPATAADASERCLRCHRLQAPALVMQWEGSRHAAAGVGCADCHRAEEGEPDAWKHEGEWVSALVTPNDCGVCHPREQEEFARSHHAKAGEILASLDNVLAEKIAGMPGNNADAVNGCLQCHGSLVRILREPDGQVRRVGSEGKPMLDPETWPNSGMGRLNPDGSRGSCHACHSRHAFEAKMSRAPENCGKCHLGPDHPQIEIYEESKHGIAFHTNRDAMALDKPGEWILGRDYSAAPTCATCHISGYMTPDGLVRGNSHDVGERISWTLRPVVSTKINLVLFEEGPEENWPEGRELPKPGDRIESTVQVVENGELTPKTVTRTVAEVVTWQERRERMKAVCHNCHEHTYVDNFYLQFDSLVTLYNEKFAIPAQVIMNDLAADGLLDPKVPFGEPVQWTFFELWHHEGRRARHGAAMMGPDYTHWHGMYEVSKHFYDKFLPQVVELAERKGKGEEWRQRVKTLLEGDEHAWTRGMTPEESKRLREAWEDRYGDGE